MTLIEGGAMIKVKTSDLIGPALDWAVAKADGLPLSEESCQDDFILIGTGCGDLERFRPSTDWSQGGPLIEKYRLEIIFEDEYWCCVRGWIYDEVYSTWPRGETHLVAACRAIVAAKLGDEVQVPDELVQEASDGQ